jgi:polyisoprenoid-binding protein YceI
MTTTTVSPSTVTGTWAVDPAHSRLGFAARHAMVATVRGDFAEFTGTAHVEPENPAASYVEVSIDAASIRTGNDQRDEHLRSPDFLDVDQYKTLTFRSTEVELVDDETYLVKGDLTVRDVTKPVTVEFTHTGTTNDPWGNVRAGFEGQTTISRKDFGLKWNVALEGGGVLVGDKVKLEFDIAAIRQN